MKGHLVGGGIEDTDVVGFGGGRRRGACVFDAGIGGMEVVVRAGTLVGFRGRNLSDVGCEGERRDRNAASSSCEGGVSELEKEDFGGAAPTIGG